MNDSQKIENLYESIRKNDYFLLNEKDFNWDEFIKIDEGFLNLASLDLYSYLFESFEKIKTENNSDTYEIKLHNGLIFYVIVNYIDGKKAKAIFDNKILDALIGKNQKVSKEYKDNRNNIADDEKICIVMFKDSEGRTDRTGSVKMSAKELFMTLKNALFNSWANRDFPMDGTIVLRSSKNDTKRLDFYKFIFKKYFPNAKFLIDNETESDYNILYIFRK